MSNKKKGGGMSTQGMGKAAKAAAAGQRSVSPKVKKRRARERYQLQRRINRAKKAKNYVLVEELKAQQRAIK